jgi:predicted solute-binding protein
VDLRTGETRDAPVSRAAKPSNPNRAISASAATVAVKKRTASVVCLTAALTFVESRRVRKKLN